MKITIAMPAKAPKDPLIIAGLEYLERSSYKSEAFLFDARMSTQNPQQRMQKEGDMLLKKTEKSFRIALCLDGKEYSSDNFQSYLEKLSLSRSHISFIIGGAFGLSHEVLKSSDARIKLSFMTLPHRLAFVLLCEQLYRTSEIKRGSPYHK